MNMFGLRWLLSTITIMVLTASWGIASEAKSRFSFEGEIEQSLSTDWNYNLDADDEEGVLKIEPGLSLEMEYEVNKNTFGFISLQSGRELKIDIEDDERERSYKSTLEIEEAYIHLKGLSDADDIKSSLTIGRFNLNDNREWLYDKNLDGILVSFEFKEIDTEISLSINKEEIIGSDLIRHDDEDTVKNYFLIGEYEQSKELELTAYTIVRDDRHEKNENQIFYGLTTKGELADKQFSFWADFGWSRGKDDEKKINGYGLDVGTTMFSHKAPGAYLTLAYAYGSGDGDRDTDFRQTDLQGNSDKFGGVTSFKYYGEVFDPELSNLHIYTAGIGYRFNRSASVDLVYHHYQQDQASDKLRSSDLDSDPDGISKNIGSELDVVAGFSFAANIETELVLGYFQPGSAFDDNANGAVKIEAKISYSF